MPRKPLTDDTDYDPDAEPQHPAPAGSLGEGLPEPEPQPQPRRRPSTDQVVDAVREGRGPIPEPQPEPPNYDGEQGEHPTQPSANGGGSRLRRGWSAANTQIDKNSDYAQAFKPDENVTYIIRFLEDDPYVTYNRHWIRRPSQKGGTVPVPFTCLRSDGIERACPLCDVLGDAPKSVTSFNIAVVERDGSVGLKSFDCTAKTFRTIQNFARDQMYAPLTKRWWAVKKTKDARGYSEITAQPIMSDASLHTDYQYTVPTLAAMKEIGLYEPDIVQIKSASELMEIAKEMQAQEEFDPYGDS